MDGRVAQCYAQGSSNRAQRDTRARHQRLKQHVAGTCRQSIAAACRMQSRRNQPFARFQFAGDAFSDSSFRPESDHRALCLLPVPFLQRRLQCPDLFCVHSFI
jgi:hypothetical protein